MKLLTRVALFTVVLLPTVVNAQKGNGLYTLEEEPKTSSTTDNKTLPKEGTYQFRIAKNDYSIVLPKNFMYEIESLRKVDEAVTVKIDDYVDLYIPSRNTIYSSSFLRLEEFIFTTN